MEKIIELLGKNDIEITDDLKSEIKNIWEENIPKTDDLFTQDDVDDIVKKRLGRAQSSYESEIKELKEAMEDMIDPEKVEEYETKIKELENKSNQREAELKTNYELQLSAKNAGVKDLDYFDFLVDKRGMKDRLKLDEEGDVVAVDSEGNIMTTEDGKKLGASVVVNEIAEDKPDILSKKEEKDIGGGAGNPKDKPSKDKIKNTINMIKEMGYNSKKESE